MIRSLRWCLRVWFPLLLVTGDGRADEPWPSLFDPFRVQTIHLQLDPATWDAIRHDTNFYDPELNIRVPCQMWMSGDSPPNSPETAITVQIRRKSDPALPSEADPRKVSLKLDINEYVPGQSIRGLKKLSLENGSGNGVLKEAFAMNLHRMAAEAGFSRYPAGYASWVRLVVNGDYVGLYACPEQRDATFLKNRGMFREGACWLYEINGGIFLDETVNTTHSPTHAQLNYYPFRGPNAPPGTVDFEREVSEFVDMRQMLTLAAIEAFIANPDGLFTKSASNQGKNSFCADWLPATRHRRYYMAWDLDGGFSNTTWDIFTGGSGQASQRRYQTMILGHPWFGEMYRQIFSELLDGPLSASALNAWLDQWAAVVAPALAEDPNADSGELASLRGYIAARVPNIRGQIGSIILPPVFSPGGGEMVAGFPFTLSHPNNTGGQSTLHYTTDGSDPRAPGGAVAATALAYSGPVTLHQSARVRARVRNVNGGTVRWSNERHASFGIAGALDALKLTEIHYRPLLGAPYEDRDEFEYVEFLNTGAAPLRLDGCRLEGVEFEFPDGTVVAPGAYFLLVANPAAFASRYPGVAYQGVFWKKLSNSGEKIRLHTADGTTVISCAYGASAPWPLAPQFDGRSLVNLRPDGDPDDPANWRASTHPHGSPGAPDPAPPYTPGLVINEVVAKTSKPLEDAIEVHNPSPLAIDISGWWLSDAFDPVADPVSARLKRYRVPQGTVVPAGGFAVFYEYQFNPASPTADAPSPFALSQDGEMACLASADAAGNLTGHIVAREFGAAETNRSHGRIATSAGWDFGELAAHTFGVSSPAERTEFRTGAGAANAPPRVGPVVISEIHYQPADEGAEFVELLNISEASVNLAGWTLRGTGHVFAPGATLGPGALLVLTNAADPAVFRSAHAVPPEAQVLAASFKLDNSGEALTLTQPNSDPARPAIVVERVRYNNKVPWPVEAAGAGFSLERIAPAHYGNEPLNWHCGTPGGSPGRRPSAATSTVITRGGEWRFHATGRDLGAAWRGPAYRDNAWPAGRSPLGFGAAVATALPYATAPRPLVTWLRKEFAVADPPDAIATLTAAIDYNDGFVAYLNGSEVLRRSLPPGADALTAADPHPHGVPELFDLTPFKPLLAPGRNVLAVQLHLADPVADGDAYFDAVVQYTRLVVQPADGDQDGIPDDWELANGLSPDDPADALLDFDGDGFSNLEEYLSGTDPRDGASRLGFAAVTTTPSSCRLTFATIANRIYTVEWSPDLREWFTLAGEIHGTGGTVAVEDDDATGFRRFYRLSVRL